MGYGLTQTVAPAVEPVSRAEAKLWLRVDADLTEDDALIDALIAAARKKVEDFTGRQLITATWRLTLDGFPGEGRNGDGCGIEDGWRVYCPNPPLIAVSSIVYAEQSAGTSTTLAASDYRVDAAREPGVIEPTYDEGAWPVSRDQAASVTITYTAGYGAAATAVPDGLKLAMRLAIAHWYDNRAEVVTGTIATQLPMAFEALAGPFRHGHLF